MKLPPLWLPGCPHRPTPKQWLALSLPDTQEILYGGAAGGGKTDWILMSALQHVDVPGYSAIIFRRTYKQLDAPEDGLMARAQQWFGGHPDFIASHTVLGSPTRWRYKGGGTITFDHMQHEKDKYNHKGPSYQFIGFDELTDFSQSQYEYLANSRLRRLEEAKWIPLRVRSASNPGGVGHDWVREKFPIPRDGKRRPKEGFHFIPAKLSDNPYLDREAYAATLSKMHPFERQQLLDGNWDATPPGSRFKRHWWKFVEAHEVPRTGVRQVRRWDLAATEPKPGRDPDWTVGTLLTYKAPDSFVEDVVRGQWEAKSLDDVLLATARMDGQVVPIRIEQEPGSSGKIAINHFRTVLAGFDLRGVPSTGDKVVRSNPVASDAEAGCVYLVRSTWNNEWMQEFDMFTGKQSAHDDQVDSLSGAHSDVTSGSSMTPAGIYGKTGVIAESKRRREEEARANGNGAAGVTQ